MNTFISYRHKDVTKVRRFVAALKNEADLSVFWDDEIPAGTNWRHFLAQQLVESSVFVLFLSEAALESDEIYAEVALAKDRKVKIIPVFLEDVKREKQHASDIIFATRGIQAVLAFDQTLKQSVAELLESIRSRSQRQGQKVEQCPVVAIMSTQGGTGKSTILMAIAELVASTGKNVAIIDTDVETRGITTYLESRVRQRTNTTNVLDALYAKATDKQESPGNKSMWDVTPDYLQAERFGRILLIPSRSESDDRLRFEMLAEASRNDQVLLVLEGLVARAKHHPKHIDLVLIDCEGNNNPLVSAAFLVASYGFIVVRPDLRQRSQISVASSMHARRYPGRDITPMAVIVNQATPETEQLWGLSPSTYFVPDDSAVRLAATRGGYDFEGVGLNNFYHGVLQVLTQQLSAHQHLLPNEADVWIRPFLEAMEHFPDEMLAMPKFRFLTPLTAILVLMCGLVAAGSGYVFVSTMKSSGDFVVSRELPGPTLQSQKDFQKSMEHLAVSGPLSNRINLEGQVVRAHGMLTTEEVIRLKSATTNEALRDVFVELGALSEAKQTELSGKRLMHRQLSMIAVIAAIVMVVSRLLMDHKLRGRKKLLWSIIRARDGKRSGELKTFTEKLVQDELVKPELKWLRDEFRKYAPTLNF